MHLNTLLHGRCGHNGLRAARDRSCRKQTATLTRDFRTRVASETWSQQIERIQRSALEKAVSVVNRMISSAERDHNIRGVEALPSAVDDGQYDDELKLTEQVQLNIKAKTSVLQSVNESPIKSLHDYLSLPVEDYNTLDPSVVQSLGDNRFLLTPPFNDWFKINIKPEVILRIQPEPSQSRVLFVCESIRFGDENIDKTGKLTFVSALSREEVAEGPRTGDPEVFLVSASQVSLAVSVGTRAARVAPVRALEALSSRVLQATLQACTKPYLRRLVEDYQHWAAGKPRLTGDITPQEASALFLDTEATVLAELEAGAPPASDGVDPPGSPKK
eukprot:jgi/Ulvmu1/10061/UM006_0008.1